MTNTLTVPLEGKQTKIERRQILVDLLILDIENPRIQYFLDTSLNIQPTPESIMSALAEGNPQYPKLKENIELNHGIINPVWVVPQGAYYRVIEGNSRSLAYKELSLKHVNDEQWKSIDAYVLPSAVERYKINFIRLEAHLFGSTPWDAYEKARELWRLNSEEDYSFSRLANLTKLSKTEIEVSIQAFKDMTEVYLPKYGKPGEQLKYSYFAEFRKNSDLKQLVRQGSLSLRTFCELVGEDKFRRGEDVRKLGLVWKDSESRTTLLEDNMEAALDQLEQTNPAAKSKLFEKIDQVINGLHTMKYAEYTEIKQGLAPAKVSELQRLHHAVGDFLSGIGALA